MCRAGRLLCRVVAGLGLSVLCGCAGYSITHNGTGAGYDVYRPEPYLMVRQGQKELAAEIVWLPNYNESYRIDAWNLLGKAEFQFEIEDGWRLTRITHKSDNTALASDLVDVVQKAAQSGTFALSGDFQLFRLVFDQAGAFVSLQPVPVLEVE